MQHHSLEEICKWNLDYRDENKIIGNIIFFLSKETSKKKGRRGLQSRVSQEVDTTDILSNIMTV